MNKDHGKNDTTIEVERTSWGIDIRIHHLKKLAYVFGALLIFIFGFFFHSDLTERFFGLDRLTYHNDIAGYSFQYPKTLDLFVDRTFGSKSPLNVSSMVITSSDALLMKIYPKSVKNIDNVLFSIIEISSRPGFITVDEYKNTLLKSLDLQKNTVGFSYSVAASVVGDEISSTEYSVHIPPAISKDTSGSTDGKPTVFYENIFERNGKSFSISLLYVKNTARAEEYMTEYRNLLRSFKVD